MLFNNMMSISKIRKTEASAYTMHKQQYSKIKPRVVMASIHNSKKTMNDNYTKMIEDIRMIIKEANACNGMQCGECECNSIWECGRAWDALDEIETVLKQHEQYLHQPKAMEPEHNRSSSLITIDAWDVIG